MTTTLSAKEREHEDWTRVAPGWKKHDARLRASYAPVTERMLQTARVGARERVLDIACGTGEPALSAAEQVGPAGYVLGTDFVEEMLAFARLKAARRGLLHVDFRRVDGEELEVPAGSFDAVLIRWGLMLMPDPLACLVRARRALRTGGRISVACWAGPDRNPAIAIPMSVLMRHVDAPDLGAPGAFAFADPDQLRATLERAGFCDVELEQVPIDDGGEHDDGVAFCSFVREVAVPAARLFAQLAPAQQRETEREIAGAVEVYRRGKRVGVPGLTWIAHARG
jgi:enediyne biosynthesis protein CalE5